MFTTVKKMQHKAYISLFQNKTKSSEFALNILHNTKITLYYLRIKYEYFIHNFFNIIGPNSNFSIITNMSKGLVIKL